MCAERLKKYRFGLSAVRESRRPNADQSATISALAAKSRLSGRAVQQILGRLTVTGRIERISGGGHGHANEYRVLVTKKPEAETVNQIHRKQNTETKTPIGIQPLGVKRVNLTAEKGEPGAPLRHIHVRRIIRRRRR
jgi:hypothetical protein